MDIEKEREAFNKEFGIDDADTFPAFSGGIENSAALKCNWLGWKKRAEFEYRENPETIEIDGLKTIHKLCKFGADHNMDGCTFTEIVERMFDELTKAQSIPDGFVLVPRELSADEARKHAEAMFNKVERMARNEQRDLSESEFELFKNRWIDARTLTIQFDWKAMIEAQEQSHDS